MKNTFDKSRVLMQSFNRACDTLEIELESRAKIVGVSELIYAEKQSTGFEIPGIESELQLIFLHFYKHLFSLAGGNNDFMLHWFYTKQQHLNATPADICKSKAGLSKLTQYMESINKIN
ncbi:hypothetical protein [Psychrosphaera algicola]|uniref:Antitoxin Xre/MbcA/ParS-like toxin-binding domain-containing protein n=1 Tax=Psychrosphaera algicola TaxID=3023714 RepID=A0ABT5FGZ2_9GAMM|nr:hypothetical protein [Psychrosphaera sp. G1-22]MDC2890360.1 hypothetical protein [Psychrosphaera sp. G1-22]